MKTTNELRLETIVTRLKTYALKPGFMRSSDDQDYIEFLYNEYEYLLSLTQN
jgi:hypothetical protein